MILLFYAGYFFGSELVLRLSLITWLDLFGVVYKLGGSQKEQVEVHTEREDHAYKR